MKEFLNPWVIAGSVIVASLLLMLSFLVAGQLTDSDLSVYSGEAALTVIPIPTYTPTPMPTQAEFPVLTPTLEAADGVQVDGYVRIFGTEGEGLRLRSDPSLAGGIVYVGLEGEIFKIAGGPVEQDGYLWWQLEAPLNTSLQGWAVSNYLEPAQSP